MYLASDSVIKTKGFRFDSIFSIAKKRKSVISKYNTDNKTHILLLEKNQIIQVATMIIF